MERFVELLLANRIRFDPNKDIRSMLIDLLRNTQENIESNTDKTTKRIQAIRHPIVVNLKRENVRLIKKNINNNKKS